MDELKDGFQGRVIVPQDEGYEEARTLFNAMIDKRPAVIAQCESPDDVAAAVRFGREHDLPTAVRGGGHSVAGMSTVDDGIVVDVRRMKAIAVDPGARTARCGSGLTWASSTRPPRSTGSPRPAGGSRPRASPASRSAAGPAGWSASAGSRATT